MTTNWYATDLFITAHIADLRREADEGARRSAQFRLRHPRLDRLLHPGRGAAAPLGSGAAPLGSGAARPTYRPARPVLPAAGPILRVARPVLPVGPAAVSAATQGLQLTPLSTLTPVHDRGACIA